jgi:hypothetical protein
MIDHPVRLTEPAFEVACELWTNTRPANVREGLLVTLKYGVEWGADQELQACLDYITTDSRWFCNPTLRAAELQAIRRPLPPTLKLKALKAVQDIEDDVDVIPALETIRLALEALPDV